MPQGLEWRTQELKARHYPAGFKGLHDRLMDAVREHAHADSLVLDAGCGSGRGFVHRLAGATDEAGSRLCRQVVGVDATDEVGANPNLDYATVGDLGRLPFRTGAFDIVICCHVAEHLEEPIGVFGELARVLKQGGRLLLLTPNRRHYVTIAARCLPYRLHRTLNGWRGVAESDVFPTRYRANTVQDLNRLCSAAGLAVVELTSFEAEPDYLAFHPAAYRCGVWFERTVNRFRHLSGLRQNLLLHAVRPGPG